MKNIYKKIFKNKFYLFIFIIVILGLGWWVYGKFFNVSAKTKYVLTEVQKGTLDVSVSGTGFVLAKNQVDVKSKVSGDVVVVPVKEGDKVSAGTLILKLDTRDPEKNVRDAEINLENAKLTLEKLKKQYEQALRADTLNKNYEDGMTILSNLYNDYPMILNNLEDILFGEDLSSTGENNIEYYSSYSPQFSQVPEQTTKIYNEIKNSYQSFFDDYNIAQRGSGDDREKAILESYKLVVKTADLIKISRDTVLNLENNLILDNAIHKKKAIIDSHLSSLTSYGNTINNYLTNLLGIVNNINSYKDSISNYPLDIKNQELVVRQRENALADAKDKLSDYYIRAPFSGIVTNILFKVGDTISPGTVATVITEDKIAQISLNEIDAAQVKVGQQAVLTFDALPDLKINGKVYEISTVGTESQGVVSYDVKINFSDGSGDIKPGMSVTANIITKSKDNVLLIPNAAIKTFAGNKYVDKPVENINLDKVRSSMRGGITLSTTTRQMIKTGLSNDQFSEVTEGLNEGDIIILRTINAQQSNLTNQNKQTGSGQSSAVFRFPGAGR
jgi:HlyD family secretion protein